MKTVIWYLPSGAGGMAAYHKAMDIRKHILNWAESKDIPIQVKDQLTFTSINGFRYYQLTLPDEDATIFALSWNNDNPKIHYEYIR